MKFIPLIDGFKTFKDVLDYLNSEEFKKDLEYYHIELIENYEVVIKNHGFMNYEVNIILEVFD